MTVNSPDLLTYIYGLVSSLPPANYTRVITNMIDHIYIAILPRSAHAIIRKHFSLLVTQQQKAHDRRFHRSRTIPHIMSVYWDHAKEHLNLLAVLKCLRLVQDMKLYHLILKAWNTVSVALLQRVRNVQIIVETLVYNRTRIFKQLTKRPRNRYAVPKPYGTTLVQMYLYAHVTNTIPLRTLLPAHQCLLPINDGFPTNMIDVTFTKLINSAEVSSSVPLFFIRSIKYLTTQLNTYIISNVTCEPAHAFDNPSQN